ncbi:MAG: ABC transporter permease [Candidatus Kapaibacterium sp.]
MSVLFYILQKEFRQIFRNSAILRVIFVAPVFQLLIFPLAADYEVRNVTIAVVDADHSTLTNRLVGELNGSTYFKVVSVGESYNQALHLVEHDKADIILQFPNHFERTLIKENSAQIFIAANAINGVKAGLGASYLQGIIRDFNQNIRAQLVALPRFNAQPTIDVQPRFWYNQFMDYHKFMVPGILVQLLTMVGVFMTALNIVREKEIGTIEQINVTPIRKWQFILGKLLPFLIIGFIVFTLGLTVARFAYGIIPVGSLPLAYGFVGLYLLAVLGLGLFVSTVTHTQQQAMFVSFFFMMVFLLLGGLFTPIESMPDWAQTITRFNPMSYFIRVIRMIVLKGSTFTDLQPEFNALAVLAMGMNILALVFYRKRS